MTAKMHDDELEIDAPLVRRLLEEQFPEWATLPLERVELMGTDNALYRLGDRMVVRLPADSRASGESLRQGVALAAPDRAAPAACRSGGARRRAPR